MKNCSNSLTHSITTCVRDYVSRIVGCKMEWDKITSKNIPLCTTHEQFRNHTKVFASIRAMTKSNLTSITQCLPMCNYYKYEVLKMSTINDYNGTGFKLILANNEITLVTEELAVDPLTFLSNFGGSLSLFVGFSLLMIWDMIVSCYYFIRQQIVSKSTSQNKEK